MDIIDTLKKKRNDMAAEIRNLTSGLEHIDATIKLFEPEYAKPRTKHGGITRAIFDVLRTAECPMTTREIAEAIGMDAKRTGIALNAQAKRKQINQRRSENGLMVWGFEGS